MSGHRVRPSRHVLRSVIAATVGLAITVAAAVGAAAGPASSVASNETAKRTPALTYLAMGDSNVYGPADSCDKCVAYPNLLAAKHPAAVGAPVTVLNASQWNRLTVAKLLDEIRSDDWGGSSGLDPLTRLPGAQPSPRRAIAQADLITIQVGFNDLPWLATTDPCHQVYDGACAARVIPALVRDLDQILGQVDNLRSGRPTAVRLANVFNDVIPGGYDNTAFYGPKVLSQGLTGVKAFVDELSERTCAVAHRHHARCLDLYTLFNGRRHVAPVARGVFTPDFGDINQPGQDAIAKEILRLGFAPLPDQRASRLR